MNFGEMIRNGYKYVIPPLCYYEAYWYLLKKKAEKQIQIFKDLYNESLHNFYMGEADFTLAARLKAELIEKGSPIGSKDADIFIAAYCINNGYTLVTDNTGDFGRIDSLRIVNWK